MDKDTAEKIADVLIGAALLGAAVVVIRTPTLRRLAWGIAVTTLTATLPAWINQEARQAWAESEPAAR